MAVGAIQDRTGLLRVMTNEQLEADKAHKRSMYDVTLNDPLVSNLSTHIQKHWEAAKNTKWYIEERLLKCMRQRKGEYDPDDIRHIKKFGGSEIYMMLTNVKCRSIEAWVKDVMLPAGEKPWSVSMTPSPDLPWGRIAATRC